MATFSKNINRVISDDAPEVRFAKTPSGVVVEVYISGSEIFTGKLNDFLVLADRQALGPLLKKCIKVALEGSGFTQD